MIYRVHRPHNPNGYGTLLGYINLCNGHIDINHIHENLLRTKIISEQWLSPEELQAVAATSNIYGLYAYTVLRRQPYARTHLFYLHPVESKAEQQSQPINNWSSIAGYTFTGSTIGTIGGYTFSPTATSAPTYIRSDYIISSPATYVQQTPIAQRPIFNALNDDAAPDEP